jgi:uncharacterized protein YjhX (UPF0386 family)
LAVQSLRIALAETGSGFGPTRRPGFPGIFQMNVSRLEQRILHLLARGGRIDVEKDDNGKIELAHCITREGWRYPDFDLTLFKKLKSKRAVASSNGGPYRITREGLRLVRAQLDNR